MKKLFMGLAWVVIFVVAGCSNDVKDSNDKTRQAKHHESSYMVKHAMGVTTVNDNPQRVVILTNEGTEALLKLGIKPVGAVKSWVGNPWFDHISSQMNGVEVVGLEGEPNLEKIATLKPDLIIGNKFRHEAIYEQLTLIAPTVFSEVLRSSWKENFMVYAKAVNKEELGKKTIAEFDFAVKNLSSKLKNYLYLEISMVRFMGGDVRIYHKDSFSGVILEQIGFSRPVSQNIHDLAERGLTRERIPAMDGDVLFYFTYETGDGEASTLEKEWINDPLFKNLNVYKSKHIAKVSDVIWNTAGGVMAAHLMLQEIETYFTKQYKQQLKNTFADDK